MIPRRKEFLRCRKAPPKKYYVSSGNIRSLKLAYISVERGVMSWMNRMKRPIG